MTLFDRTRCFGCDESIWCTCQGPKARFCPIHTPTRYGELCRPCYLGVLAEAAGLAVAV